MTTDNLYMQLQGVRTHNCKNIAVKFPLHRLTCVTGVSGSGKSSLVFATLFQEAQRRFSESLSRQESQFINVQCDARLDYASNLPPAIAVHQHRARSARSTLSTLTEVGDLVRLLYCQNGERFCYKCEKKITPLAPDAGANFVLTQVRDQSVTIAAPLRYFQGAPSVLLTHLKAEGFTRFISQDGAHTRAISPEQLVSQHVITARFPALAENNRERLQEAIATSYRISRGRAIIFVNTKTEFAISQNSECLDCKIEIATPSPAFFSYTHPAGACQTCEGAGCDVCGGTRLQPRVRAYRWCGLTFPEALRLSANELRRHALTHFAHGDSLPLSRSNNIRRHTEKFTSNDRATASIYAELKQRLIYLEKLKIDYLTLDRPAHSMSWGELQRAKLALCMGTDLVDTLYCLDEPTTGLHARDSHNIFKLLQELRDRQNTVVVVEHDRHFVENADYLLVLGEGAGTAGGKIIYVGAPRGYRLPIADIKRRRLDKGRSELKFMTLQGAKTHNLKNVDVKIPLQRLTCVCGVSGCGKSSLIHHTLYPLLLSYLGDDRRAESFAPEARKLVCADEISDVVVLDQRFSTRNRRSNIATFLGIYSVIRDLFASLQTARRRGFTRAYFSFNTPKGRCNSCTGLGFLEKDLAHLGIFHEQCPACDGRQFRDEVLTIEFSGRNIREVLELTLEEAQDFFRHRSEIVSVIARGISLGLGYLTLGQPLSSLSGGEIQRLRLVNVLLPQSQHRGGNDPSYMSEAKRVVYIFDEPSSGLADQDIALFLKHVEFLVEAKQTVIIIDHHLQIINFADWIIELGPRSADEGGELLFCGDRENFLEQPHSATAEFLREMA